MKASLIGIAGFAALCALGTLVSALLLLHAGSSCPASVTSHGLYCEP
jgi:hypothetical protein